MSALSEIQQHAAMVQRREQWKRRRFDVGVYGATALLLALLLWLFSGWQVEAFGFRLTTIQLDWAFISEWWLFIAGGVGMTILLAALSITLASVLALFGALGRLSKFPPAYALATFYISLIRGTPLLLQIVFFFLALPQLGILLTGFTAGILALGLNYGAYMTEIFRAGIEAVGRGQREAALALGMSNRQILRLIVLPQALRIVIPPVGNDFIAMLKDTALVSVTGFVHETLWRAQKVGRANFKSLEALLVAAIFYWIITIIFSAIQSRIEARLAQGDRR